MFHYVGHLKEAQSDMALSGWDVPEKTTHNWEQAV